MKTNTLKTIGIAVYLFAGVGTAAALPFVILLGRLDGNANAFNTWHITCSNTATSSVRFRIFDEAESPINAPNPLNADLSKDVDRINKFDDDDTPPRSIPSTQGILKKGSGLYILDVRKSSASHRRPENYKAEVTCLNKDSASVAPINATLQAIVNRVVESPKAIDDCSISINNCQ
jgi:hypothetical protein